MKGQRKPTCTAKDKKGRRCREAGASLEFSPLRKEALALLQVDPRLTAHALWKALRKTHEDSAPAYVTVTYWLENFYRKKHAKKESTPIHDDITEALEKIESGQIKLRPVFKKSGDTLEYYQRAIEFIEDRLAQLDALQRVRTAASKHTDPGRLSLSIEVQIDKYLRTLALYRDKISEFSAQHDLESRFRQLLADVSQLVVDLFFDALPSKTRSPLMEKFKKRMIQIEQRTLKEVQG